MTARTRRYRLTAVLTAGVLLTSCSATPEPGPGSSTTPVPSESGSASPTAEETTPEPTEEPDDAPTSGLEPFGEPAGPVSADSSAGAELRLVQLTSAEQEGYDRVVLTFEGEGTPGWQVEYQPNPSSDGSGRPIEVDGDTDLAAYVSGLVLPTEGDGQLDPQTWDPDLPQIEEIHLDGWFEGRTQLVLGIDSAEAPLRVFTATDPTRVVIDIQHLDD